MPYSLFLKKWQNLKLSSAANYRWRFKAQFPWKCQNQITVTEKMHVQSKKVPNQTAPSLIGEFLLAFFRQKIYFDD